MNDEDSEPPILDRGVASRSRAYLLVTPCRDEAEFLARTIASVLQQTVRPACWVIVNDGSTDETAQIVDAAAKEHSFIHALHRADRGGRKVGPGVIEAFREGYAHVDAQAYTYVCKMDADLDLPPRYFERLIEEMEHEPRLGAVSGKMFLRDAEGRLHHERRGDDHAAGLPSSTGASASKRSVASCEWPAGMGWMDTCVGCEAGSHDPSWTTSSRSFTAARWAPASAAC